MVAVAGIFVAGWFLIDGDEAADTARGFGLAFAATSALVMAVTVPIGAWGEAYCDAFSLPQSSLGILGGLGLAAIAAAPRLRRSLATRGASLALLAAVAAGSAAIFFPQCLSDPYSGLEPMLKTYWLDLGGRGAAAVDGPRRASRKAWQHTT